MPPQVEVEHAGPDEGQQTASEVANEAHQEREVGHEDSEEDGDQDHPHPEAQTPDLQLAVLGPDGGEESVGLPFEEFLLDQPTGRVVREGGGLACLCKFAHHQFFCFG